MSQLRWLLVGCLMFGSVVACSGGSPKSNGGPDSDASVGPDGGPGGDGDGSGGDGDGSGGDGDAGTAAGFNVQPSDMQTVSVDPGAASAPSVTFTATRNGAPIAVAWNIDRGELGAI